MSKNNLKNLTIEADHAIDAEVSDIPAENAEQNNEQENITPPPVVVKKNWIEKQADKAYAKRVAKAEQKALKAQEPKKSLREKAKDAKPKILKGLAIAGGLTAAVVGGAIMHGVAAANNQETYDNGGEYTTYSDAPELTETVAAEENQQVEDTNEAQEA